MKKYLIGICLILMAAYLPFFSLEVQAKKNVTIHQGVYIGSNDVSGLTQSEAEQLINDKINAAGNAQITLICVGDEAVTITPAEIGMKWMNRNVVKEAVSIGEAGNAVSRYKEIKDLQQNNKILPIAYEFDKQLLSTLITEKCASYDVEAIDVGLNKIDGAFQIVEGKAGTILDNEAAQTAVYDYLCNEWDGNDTTITLPTVVDEPKGSADELSLVTDVLGTFTTSYTTSGADRSANVANGCRLVNGITLYPGDTFSMYDAIKPFSVENGYHMAGSYVNGMVVDSLGGGICQVSTTLYNAVLRAELEITERNNHSMIVGYVPASADAAIAESSGKDFKFTNNSEYPVYIEGITTPDKHIVFNIYGHETRPEGKVVTFESEILETVNPTSENIIQTTSQPLGFIQIQSAHIGYKAKLWKIVTINGVEESREVVNQSSYKMVPRTATVGVSTNDVEAYNQMQAAIATGSIDQAKAVADAHAAPPPAPENPAPEQAAQ